MTVQITTDIKKDDIASLLCSALEGGSNYWYTITEFIEPPKIEFMTDADLAKSMQREPQLFKHIDYPLNEGGALMIGDDEDPEHNPTRLDLPAIQKGLQLMAEKHPKHWADFIDENADAETGDVFLQLCLFGDVIYG